MSMQQLAPGQSSPEVPINENFQTLEAFALFGKRQPATSGLTWGYYGGRWSGSTVADGTLTLTDASANYIVVEKATGTISTSTSTTNWNDSDYGRVYKITTAGGLVTAVEDHRIGSPGIFSGDGGAGAAERNTSTALATSGSVAIDYSDGDYFTLALAGNVTAFSFSNLPGSGKAITILIQITQDSTPRTVNLSAFTFAAGADDTVSTGSGAVDVLALTSFDNGSTWRATLAKDFS